MQLQRCAVKRIKMVVNIWFQKVLLCNKFEAPGAAHESLLHPTFNYVLTNGRGCECHTYALAISISTLSKPIGSKYFAYSKKASKQNQKHQLLLSQSSRVLPVVMVLGWVGDWHANSKCQAPTNHTYAKREREKGVTRLLTDCHKERTSYCHISTLMPA